MTDKLPSNLLALFAPRPPLRYIPPSDRAPDDIQKSTISGVAQFVNDLHKYGEEVPYNATESWLQRKARLKAEKQEQLEKHITDDAREYNPADDPQVRGDAFKTLFVSRLSYDVKEADLEREFSRFGPIERIRIVVDTHNPKKNSKKTHRGYGFIVYEREKDMKAAYKETDGIRIKDRRILVDVERGRTVKGWKPRRFGGGLGGRGYTKAMPARPMGPGGFNAPSGPGGFQGGGFRGGFGGRGGGGFRGGFRGDRGGGDRGFGGRGGIGYQGGRGGFGGPSNGFSGGQPPLNAPSGPGGGRSGPSGYGGAPNGSAAPDSMGVYGDPRRGGGGYDDRAGHRGGGGGRYEREPRGVTGSNREPVRPREGDRDRDRDRDRERDRPRGDRERDRGDRGDRDRDRDRDRYSRRDDSYSRKRYHDGDSYDDPRSKRRY